MGKETNDIKRERAECSQMDSADRKKLRLLAEDADRTYTEPVNDNETHMG